MEQQRAEERKRQERLANNQGLSRGGQKNQQEEDPSIED